MISDAALADLKARNPCDQLARKWVTLRKHGKKLIGPCPICSSNRTSKRATKFECDADGFVCAGCQNGGDVIKLVQLVEQVDFRAAIAWLGGAQEIDPAAIAQREQERAAARAKADHDNNQFRERERETVYEMWKRGAAAADLRSRIICGCGAFNCPLAAACAVSTPCPTTPAARSTRPWCTAGRPCWRRSSMPRGNSAPCI